jgi:hypothetical protein
VKAPQFITTLCRPAPAMPDRYRQLCVLDNRLADLWADAAYYAREWDARPAMRARGKAAAWARIERDMMFLVGAGRPDGDDILGSKQAYACARIALRDAMGA